MKALKVIWTILKAIGGFIVGTVGVLGWLNVTPDMIGQAAYDALIIILPIMMFAGGSLSGWGITKIWSDWMMKEKDIKIDGLEREKKGKDTALAELKGKVEALEQSLRVAEANATAALAEHGEDLEDVKFRQELLRTLSVARTPTSMRSILDARINGGSIEENLRYGRAVEDLVKYGCLSYVTCRYAVSHDRYFLTVDDMAKVNRGTYPPLSERTRTDLIDEVESMVDDKLRKAERRWFG